MQIIIIFFPACPLLGGAAPLEMQRAWLAKRDALPAVRGPRIAPPKASSASTRQNDACSRCRIRRKHIL